MELTTENKNLAQDSAKVNDINQRLLDECKQRQEQLDEKAAQLA